MTRDEKLNSRIKKMCWGLNKQYVDPVHITRKVLQGTLQALR